MMDRRTVIFPAFFGGACFMGSIFILGRGEYFMGAITLAASIALAYIGERAMNAWVESWEKTLGIKK
jgi:hypothetical protein